MTIKLPIVYGFFFFLWCYCHNTLIILHEVFKKQFCHLYCFLFLSLHSDNEYRPVNWYSDSVVLVNSRCLGTNSFALFQLKRLQRYVYPLIQNTWMNWKHSYNESSTSSLRFCIFILKNSVTVIFQANFIWIESEFLQCCFRLSFQFQYFFDQEFGIKIFCIWISYWQLFIQNSMPWMLMAQRCFRHECYHFLCYSIFPSP